MKNKLKIFTLITLLIFACSKKEDDMIPDDSQTENYLSIENSNVKTFEIISIDVSNGNLNSSYQAQLGGANVELSKVNETTLALFIPYLDSGNYTLESELGSLELNVLQTELVKDKEEVITDFKDLVESNFSPTVDAPNSYGVEILDTILSNATEDEKQAIALFFEANKEVFNEIITASFARSASSTKQLANPFEVLTTKTEKFKTNVIKVTLGVAAIALGKEIVVGGVATGGLVSIGGAIIGGAGAALIYDTFPQLKQNVVDILDIAFNTDDFELNNGLSNRISQTASTTLTFTNKVSRTLTFNQFNNTLNQSDSSSSNGVIQLFFDGFSTYSNTIITINKVIELANEIPFISIDRIIVPTIPSVSSTEEIDIATENYSNYSFSTDSDEVTLSTSLAEEGKLKIYFTADDTVDFTDDLEFELKINFDDGRNTISKSFGIKLEGENLIFGEWEAVSYDGKNMGEVTHGMYVPNCDIYLESYSINSSSLVTSESTVSVDLNQTAYGLSYSSEANGDIICSSIVEQTETLNDTLTYNFEDFVKQGNSNVYILETTNSDDGEVTITLELMNENTMKFIYQAVYDATDVDRTTLIYNRN